MVLDASKTNSRYKFKQLTDFSAKENGFGCVQNQFWMNANKLNDFSAYKLIDQYEKSHSL